MHQITCTDYLSAYAVDSNVFYYIDEAYSVTLAAYKNFGWFWFMPALFASDFIAFNS